MALTPVVSRQLGKVAIKRTSKGKTYNVDWFIADSDDSAATYSFLPYHTCGDMFMVAPGIAGGTSIDADAILVDMTEVGAGEGGKIYKYSGVEAKYQF
jgi:hypothetical protein